MTEAAINLRQSPDQYIEIPFNIKREAVLENFKQERTRAKVETIVDEIIEMAAKVAKPKGIYRVACVSARDGDGVEIDGVRFNSRVLARNLGETSTVIPEIVTCGQEVDEIDIPPTEYIKYYTLNVVKQVIMSEATAYFFPYLRDKFGLTDMVHLHPGEFEDFPISAQPLIFQLFNDVEGSIGVRLTSTYTLQPMKSATGLLFSSEFNFESCELCLQAHCAARRKAYNPRLVKQFLE